MAATSGRNRPPLAEKLRQEAYRFDFFQAVRLLEWMAEEEAEAGGPQRFPVGQDPAPRADEIVRFRAIPSLSFPSGSIAGLSAPEGAAAGGKARPPEMTVACTGLIGPSGVLPQHYTALVIQRIREKDYALRDFLDLFNHRAISLFYRAWAKYRFPLAYERSQRGKTRGEEDLFTACLYCLVGLGTGGLRGRRQVDDEAFLFYAGHFAHFPRSALALELLLADYFELPVRVKQFQGQWLHLGADDQCALASAKSSPRAAKRIGDNLVVGARVWEVQSKLRVRLGPLSYGQFRRFMPSGDALRPICQMIRSYAGPHFDFDVQPVLKAEEVPACRLGGEGPDPARLGWNCWVRSRTLERDADDAVFSLEG